MFKHCKQNTGTCTVKPILSPIKTMLFMCCLLRKIKTCKVKKKPTDVKQNWKKKPQQTGHHFGTCITLFIYNFIHIYIYFIQPCFITGFFLKYPWNKALRIYSKKFNTHNNLLHIREKKHVLWFHQKQLRRCKCKHY